MNVYVVVKDSFFDEVDNIFVYVFASKDDAIRFCERMSQLDTGYFYRYKEMFV